MYQHTLSILRIFVATMALLSAQAFAADGTILAAQGDIFVNGSPAEQGDLVNSGDTLKTAFGAWMVVEMDDQSLLNVRSNTEVEITDYVYNTTDPEQNNQDVNIVDGTLLYTSGLIAANDNEDIAVRAGEMTLGVRGTSFGVRYNRADGSVTVSVTRGSVFSAFAASSTSIKDASGNTIPEGGSLQLTPNDDGTYTVIKTSTTDGSISNKSSVEKIVYEVVTENGENNLRVKSVEKTTVDDYPNAQRAIDFVAQVYSETVVKNDDGSITYTNASGEVVTQSATGSGFSSDELTTVTEVNVQPGDTYNNAIVNTTEGSTPQ